MSRPFPKRGYRFDAPLHLAGSGPELGLAVLPFSCLGPETEAHLGLGLADALIGRLTEVEGVRVRPARSRSTWPTRSRRERPRRSWGSTPSWEVRFSVTAGASVFPCSSCLSPPPCGRGPTRSMPTGPTSSAFKTRSPSVSPRLSPCGLHRTARPRVGRRPNPRPTRPTCAGATSGRGSIRKAWARPSATTARPSVSILATLPPCRARRMPPAAGPRRPRGPA